MKSDLLTFNVRLESHFQDVIARVTLVPKAPPLQICF